MPEKITDFVVQYRLPDGSPWTDHGGHDDLEAARRFVERRTPDADREWRIMRRTWTQVDYAR